MNAFGTSMGILPAQTHLHQYTLGLHEDVFKPFDSPIDAYSLFCVVVTEGGFGRLKALFTSCIVRTPLVSGT